jgi:hypothetical protein
MDGWIPGAVHYNFGGLGIFLRILQSSHHLDSGFPPPPVQYFPPSLRYPARVPSAVPGFLVNRIHRQSFFLLVHLARCHHTLTGEFCIFRFSNRIYAMRLFNPIPHFSALVLIVLPLISSFFLPI